MTTNNLLTKIIFMPSETPSPLSQTLNLSGKALEYSPTLVPDVANLLPPLLNNYFKKMSFDHRIILKDEAQQKHIDTLTVGMQALIKAYQESIIANQELVNALNDLKKRVQELEQNQIQGFGQYEHHITPNRNVLQQMG